MGEKAIGASEPWKCTKCTAVVFIPTGHGINGGVCTQQRRGCEGEIVRMNEAEAIEVRAVMEARNMREQPWLTLIFKQSGEGG